MKIIIRLFTASLLVALSLGLNSCENNDLESAPSTTVTVNSYMNIINKLFAEYAKDYSDIKYKFGLQGEESVLLSGMKDKHIWVSEYDTVTKQLKSEWIDIEESDTILNIYKGYGEYETVQLNYILPTFYKKTSVGNIITLKFNGAYNQTIFTFNKQSKRTELQSDYQKNVAANDWYEESVFIGKYCYSNKGEIIYEAEATPQFGNMKDLSLISYEEGIKCQDRYICKYNYKESKNVWITDIESLFDIASDAKINYTLLDNSSNIWQYKCEVMFYDGSKNDFTFKINIDDGKIFNNVTSITLNESSKEIDITDKYQLTATVKPANATNTNIIWNSSNENVATVDQNGLVTARTMGETTITATTEDGYFTASCIIIVKMMQDITYKNESHT